MTTGANLTAEEEKTEDKGDEFKNMAREDLGRLKKQGEKTGNEDLKDSLGVNPNFGGLQQPEYMGGSSPSAGLTEAEKKEKEAEEDRKRNWLVDSVRKLSGEQELTDEEKDKLKNLSGDLNLVDRYVAERLREQIEEDEEKATIDQAKKDSFDESDAENPLDPSDHRPEISGLANTAPTDPLRAMEEKFISEALGKITPEQNRNPQKSEMDIGIGAAATNPFLAQFDFADNQLGDFNFSASSLANTSAGANAEPTITAPGSSMKLTEGLSFAWLQEGNNPFLSSTILAAPATAAFTNAVSGILPTFTDNNLTNNLPALNSPDLPQLAIPKLTPKIPPKSVEENEKKYLPQLNRF